MVKWIFAQDDGRFELQVVFKNRPYKKNPMETFGHIWSWTQQLKSSHLGTKIAITFSFFLFV
jgi:hypothetical protein